MYICHIESTKCVFVTQLSARVVCFFPESNNRPQYKQVLQKPDGSSRLFVQKKQNYNNPGDSIQLLAKLKCTNLPTSINRQHLLAI